MFIWAAKYHPDELVSEMELWSKGNLEEVRQYINLINSEINSYIEVMFEELANRNKTKLD